MDRGTQGVFARDKSDFQKIIRQEVQSDALLSHSLLPPCAYNPGPVPQPHGHWRVMKSSQLQLQPASEAQEQAGLRPNPRRPEICAHCNSNTAQRERETQAAAKSLVWMGQAGGEIDSHPGTRFRRLGTNVRPLGLLGLGPQIQVISSLERITEIASKLPPLCLAQLHSIKPPRGPKGGIEELGEKGLRPHKPGLGTRQGPHKRPSSEEGGLASCSFCASGKSYVSAKSQESESWSWTLQSVS